MSEPVTLQSVETKVESLIQQPGAGEVLADVEEGAAVVRATYAKSGVRTSEFWLTLAVVVGCFGYVAIQVWQGRSDMTNAAALLTAALKVAAYSKGRTDLKAAHVDAFSGGQGMEIVKSALQGISNGINGTPGKT